MIVADFRMHTQLQENDTVHIIAQKVENEWIVNNDFGLLVFEPDDLISSTSVVSKFIIDLLIVLYN